MAASKYIKQPIAGALSQYIDSELRKIEKAVSDGVMDIEAATAAIVALQAALIVTDANVAALTAAPVWTAVTFQNSWVDFGAGFMPTAYYKNPFGIVRIRGHVKNGVMASSIFTLPVGFRPSATLVLAGSGNGAPSSYGRIDVTSAGLVTPLVSAGPTTNGFVGLNIQFHAS